MKTIHVVAAIICDGDRIFATQRGYGDWKDYWEFPGGKIEPGETAEEALKREIFEELDTRIAITKKLTTVEYDYPAFHLSMDCFLAEVTEGSLVLKEHESSRWLNKNELDSVQWLPADKLIIKLLKPMNITVYLGANAGNDPALRSAVRELGSWIGENGYTLVYGGSKCGLMGELAESVLMAGGKVTGVEPRFFIEMGFDYEAITELIITENMSERKAKMIELGDAFIAFPGGTGTLEEITEVMSKTALGHLEKPCIIYNLHGYYDGLKELLRKMIEKELSSCDRQKEIYFVSNLQEIEDLLRK